MANPQPDKPTLDQPAKIFENAISQLKSSLSRADAEIFEKTTLRQVQDAAKEIEARQRERKSMRNMARLKPLFTVLEKYSRVVEVLCNGTQYLPWVWAPIKLMLQIATGFSDVLDMLLNAYSQIAEAMPDLSRIGTAFEGTPSVRGVLALIYEDILEFHRRAYKFLRRRAWHIFFESLWKSFEGGTFHRILKNISTHRELLMREVQMVDFIEAREARAIAKAEFDRREKKKEDTYVHDSIAWLKIADEGQTDTLDGFLYMRQEGTCEWVTANPIFLSWRDDAHSEPIIWLNGIPGAGKTVLCSYIINLLIEESHITAPFYICNSYTSGKNLVSDLLRSLTAQLLRKNKELAPYIFDKYANTGLAPTITHLRNLLADLLKTIPTVRMCIDGLDEFPDGEQRKIITELSNLSKGSGGKFRILFSSREVTLIERAMKGRPLISLKTEEIAVRSDISAYVHDRLVPIRDEFDEAFVTRIEEQVVTKAKGMFLWVRLIISDLVHYHSKKELQDTADKLPDGLQEAYGRILQRVRHDLGQHNSQKAIRILEWIACSFRILKLYEVQDGIVFHHPGASLNEESKMNSKILDLCKPLVQDGPNDTVEFVHYSAKEYILDITSGPFLQYSKAHHNIAFSCVLYLNTTFCFYDKDFEEDELKLRVLKGFHGLHHYASEFWFQHLLQYAKAGEKVSINDEMDDAIEELLEIWKQDPGVAAKALKLDDTTTKDNINKELEPLIDSENAYGMGQDILTVRAYLSQEKFTHENANNLKTLESDKDSSYLSDISQRYQEIVQFFISCNVNDLPPKGTPDMLDQFRTVYLDSAFICRYRNCPRFSDGFKTVVSREEHEMGHIKPLRCADPSCDHFDRGFTSRTGLAKHNRKFHPKPEELEPPAFESMKELPPVSTPPPPPRQPMPPLMPPRQPTPPPLPPTPPPKDPRLRVDKVKQTRVSRAKRGLLVHHCSMCKKVFTRAEGLRRHEVIHWEPKWLCTVSDCSKVFHRKDLLQRHLVRHEKRALEAWTNDDSDDENGDKDISDYREEPPAGERA